MIHPQFGAKMIMKGTGTPTSHPNTSTRLRPQISARWPETRFAQAFTTPKLMMKGDYSRRRNNPELLAADQGHR